MSDQLDRWSWIHTADGSGWEAILDGAYAILYPQPDLAGDTCWMLDVYSVDAETGNRRFIGGTGYGSATPHAADHAFLLEDASATVDRCLNLTDHRNR